MWAERTVIGIQRASQRASWWIVVVSAYAPVFVLCLEFFLHRRIAIVRDWDIKILSETKMSFPSFRKLAGIAMGATVLGVSVFKLMQVDKTDEICHSPYFRKAFKELRAHPGAFYIIHSSAEWNKIVFILVFELLAAVEFLGEPIEQEKFDSSDGYNFCDGTKARFAVNVKGSKDKGYNTAHPNRILSK